MRLNVNLLCVLVLRTGRLDTVRGSEKLIIFTVIKCTSLAFVFQFYMKYTVNQEPVYGNTFSL